MIGHDNNKIYQTFPSAPENPKTAQNYRLHKVSEIEKFFLDEIKEREKLTKKFRHIGNIILVADKGGGQERSFKASTSAANAIYINLQ